MPRDVGLELEVSVGAYGFTQISWLCPLREPREAMTYH